MRALRAYLAAALLVAVLTPRDGAHAEASVGGAFRHPGYGARAWGMGGAAAAIVDDESAVSWNPAMLAMVHDDHIGFSYVNLVKGTSARQSQFGYTHTFVENEPDFDRHSARHVIGVLYTNVSLDINDGNHYSENLLRAAYAFTPQHFLTVGASIEGYFSSSSVDNFGARGTSVDAAVRLNLTRNSTLAAVARDVFSRYSYDGGADYRKDRGFTLALGYTGLSHVALEGDVWWDYSAISRFILGAETDYLFDHLALRAGAAALRSGESRAVPYMGLGVRLYDEHINIHYNANLDTDTAFEDTHRFTLSIVL